MAYAWPMYGLCMARVITGCIQFMIYGASTKWDIYGIYGATICVRPDAPCFRFSRTVPTFCNDLGGDGGAIDTAFGGGGAAARWSGFGGG